MSLTMSTTHLSLEGQDDLNPRLMLMKALLHDCYTCKSWCFPRDLAGSRHGNSLGTFISHQCKDRASYKRFGLEALALTRFTVMVMLVGNLLRAASRRCHRAWGQTSGRIHSSIDNVDDILNPSNPRALPWLTDSGSISLALTEVECLKPSMPPVPHLRFKMENASPDTSFVKLIKQSIELSLREQFRFVPLESRAAVLIRN